MNEGFSSTLNEIQELCTHYEAMLESRIIYPFIILEDIKSHSVITITGLMPWIISRFNKFCKPSEHNIICELVEKTRYFNPVVLRTFLQLLETDSLPVFARTVECLDKVAPGWRSIISETSGIKTRLLGSNLDSKKNVISDLRNKFKHDELFLRQYYCSLSYTLLFDSSDEIKMAVGDLLVSDSGRYSYYVVNHKSSFKDKLKQSLKLCTSNPRALIDAISSRTKKAPKIIN